MMGRIDGDDRVRTKQMHLSRVSQANGAVDRAERSRLLLTARLL